MEKTYNLSMLFAEDEFDAQKGYNRYGSKEAYFSVLYRFTVDSEKLLEKCKPELIRSASVNVDVLTRHVVRLEGMLANIGAVSLAWRLQNLNDLLERKRYADFRDKLASTLDDVDSLRRRIVSAERSEETARKVIPHVKTAEEAALLVGDIKPHKSTRSNDFKKLVMLIDNFELESAIAAAVELMRHSYSPEIDSMLKQVYLSMEEYNFVKSLEEAKKLLNHVVSVSLDELERSTKKSILAIDDMPDVLRTVKAMLKDKYNVYGMTNYESALKFLRSNTADLILLDIEMPGLDGFAMMQLFRLLPEYANTPIVFLTGNICDEHLKMAISLGARDFISKPVDLTVLTKKLEAALSQS